MHKKDYKEAFEVAKRNLKWNNKNKELNLNDSVKNACYWYKLYKDYNSLDDFMHTRSIREINRARKESIKLYDSIKRS